MHSNVGSVFSYATEIVRQRQSTVWLLMKTKIMITTLKALFVAAGATIICCNNFKCAVFGKKMSGKTTRSARGRQVEFRVRSSVVFGQFHAIHGARARCDHSRPAQFPCGGVTIFAGREPGLLQAAVVPFCSCMESFFLGLLTFEIWVHVRPVYS